MSRTSDQRGGALAHSRLGSRALIARCGNVARVPVWIRLGRAWHRQDRRLDDRSETRRRGLEARTDRSEGAAARAGLPRGGGEIGGFAEKALHLGIVGTVVGAK